jgi:hypothetical protein
MTVRLSDGLRTDMLEGGSLESALALGFIFIYTGSQPASSNDAATGTLLVTIAVNDGATGLSFDTIVTAGVLAKAAAETWSGTAGQTGTAGWFRFNELVTDKATTLSAAAASSVTAKRLDGSIAVSGGDLQMSNTAIVAAAIQTVSTFNLTLAAQ